jgi:hypothetical protein
MDDSLRALVWHQGTADIQHPLQQRVDGEKLALLTQD